MSTYRFTGHVIDQTTHRGLPALRIEAWDAESQSTDLVSFALSDAQGAFTITLDSDHLAEHFPDRTPTLAFRVFSAATPPVRLISRPLVWKLSAESTSGRIEIAGAAGAGSLVPAEHRQPARSVVRGTLTDTAGTPLPNVAIAAFDQQPVTSEVTGLPGVPVGVPTTTDAGGQYSIAYDTVATSSIALDVPGPSAIVRPAPDLVVRAYATDGSVLVDSLRVCHAPPTVVVNLVAGGALRGPTELDALRTRLAPHLTGFTLHTASADQLSRLACTSGSASVHVSALATAQTLANATGISADAHYALLREGLPSTTTELLRLPARELRRALQNALARNTVPASVGAVETIIGQLRDQAVDLAFDAPVRGTLSLGDLVARSIAADPAAPNSSHATTARGLLSAYHAHEGTTDAFWAALPAGVNAGDVQFGLQIGAVARFHEPLVTALLTARRQGSAAYGSLRKLAKLDEAGWAALLTDTTSGPAIGAPAAIPGPDEAKTANFAKVLRRTMETLHPTAVIAGDLQRTVPTGTHPVTAFLDANEAFELGKTRVAHYLTQLAAANQPDSSTSDELRQIELLHKLTPRYTEMKVLLDAGLHSAREVVSLGRSAFVAAHGGALGGDSIAEDIFASAQSTASQALAFHGMYGAGTNATGIYAVPDLGTATGQAQAPTAAEWATLFGSPDFCNCDHCNSVYGPAAYFVDLLEFLGKHDAAGEGGPHTQTAKGVLLGKRPDLQHIDLSCDNTLTALPHVDLVNEILEHAVGTPTAGFPSHIATVGTTAELAALPAAGGAARTAAYATLGQAVYPWSLPFDLATPETRAYLEHLGVPRAELMRVLGGPAAAPLPDALVDERLGLFPGDRALLVGAAQTDTALHDLWGGLDPTGSLHVAPLLQRTGLTYDELTDLLDTKYMQAFGSPTLGPVGSCDTQTMQVDWKGNAAAPDALHRFVRLQRRLGCSVRDLDLALSTAGPSLMSNGGAVLATLSAILRLRARFGVPMAVAACWFGQLSTHWTDQGKTPSAHEQVFQNRAVQNPPDPALAVGTFSGTLADHQSAIRGALGIGAADFTMLTDDTEARAQTGAAALIAATTLVSSDSLSTLLRHVTLARALGMPLRDYLILRALAGPDVTHLPDALQADTVDTFLDTVERVQRSGFAPVEILYLLAGVEAPRTSQKPTDTAVAAVLDLLYAGLLKIRTTQLAVGDPAGVKLGERLALLVSNATLRAQLMGIIDGSLLADPAATGYLDTAAAQAVFDASMAVFFIEPNAVRDGLIGAQALAALPDRYDLAFSHLPEWQNERYRFVQQSLGAALGLDAATTDALLTGILTSSAGTLADAFRLDEPPAAVPAPALRDAYRRLARAATIVERLGMSADEVKHYGAPGSASILDLDAASSALPPPLPAPPAPPNPALFAALLTLVDVLASRSAVAAGSAGLLSVFTASASSVAGAASAAFGWPAADVATLCASGNALALSFGTVSATAGALLRLRDAMGALQRLGVSADAAAAWVAPTLTLTASAAAVQAARSRHTDAEWTAVAPDLRNPIRDAQRNALVAYLVAAKQYTDADQLFSDLYVDVQVAPCQLTSRIKQAIGSVQTFTQRTLLGLEPSAKLSPEAAKEWAWRRSYRVWEANRKIFLYPENWIYPELRDDKSPFFKQLESDLRQKDITDDVAEDAYARYLESLEQVAKLEVVAMCHQKENAYDEHDAIDVLHVIGRTRLEPYRHFYRTRVDSAYWTAWEPIDLDVDGDHLVLMVVNRRIHLFWPLIETKPDKGQGQGSLYTAGPEPRKHLEIRMAWSEFHNKKWSARRLSKGDPVTFSPSVDAKRLTFVPAGDMKIDCLLNPGLWRRGHRGLFQLGYFQVQACGGQVSGHDRKLSFVSQGADIEDLEALIDKIKHDVDAGADADQDQLAKDQVALQQAVGKVNSAPALLDAQLDAAEVTEIKLTLPALAVRVYQDDMQMPDDKVDPNAPDLADKNTLTLPISLAGSTQAKTVLAQTPTRFRVLARHNVNYGYKDTYPELDLLFYKDAQRTFFAELTEITHTDWIQGPTAHPGLALPAGALTVDDALLGGGPDGLAGWAATPPDESMFAHTTTTRGYRFWTFYHPYACDFLKALHRGGVSGLLAWSAQKAPPDASIQFSKANVFGDYHPQDAVHPTRPLEDVDFSFAGPFARYNWEVFFHIPFLVATRLMQNQRFDEAQKWFHYIFDPSAGGKGKAPQRFWKVKPFYENHDLATIQEQIAVAGGAQSDGSQQLATLLDVGDAITRVEIEAQVEAWQKDPFNPHVIARLRPLAYQKAVVMKYIENLLAWGDQLFGRDTLESINEATQLYILASSVLGPRPVAIQPPGQTTPKTYFDLPGLAEGPFSDPMVSAETLVRSSGRGSSHGGGLGKGYEAAPDLRQLLFCVPQDEMLLGLWDTVADRLFKLRHCMNIDGVVRQLPLFEPPIDPALLVRAAAAGVDIGSALDDLNQALPHYRFSVMHAKAMELSGGVTALGGAFLAALEKKDAEGMSRLRSSQEIDLLNVVREVKAEQLREAGQTLRGLEVALEIAQARHDYYAGLPKVSAGEFGALETSQVGMTIGTVAQAISSGASSARAVPTVTFGAAGWAGSPVTVAMAGGEVMGGALDSVAHGMSMFAGVLRDEAATLATIAGYDRRWDEWKLQQKLAAKEIQQVGKQILAAQIRVAIAEKDLDNHDLQIQHAREVSDYLRDKFTSEDLYDWMVSELSTVYFQSYKLAYDVARRAEKAYRYERAVETSSYITFGYWDSLKKGLLAGERLQHDLRRLDVAYLEQNAREYEITKHVSLACLDPAMLMTLRDTGACSLSLTERMFDLDFPGHYLRRIKSVSLTIPAVNGPYAGVNCTLRLKTSTVRKSAKTGTSGSILSTSYIPVASTIVTSSAQNDSGVFELNFRDERFLPFEGAGAQGDWEIALPRGTNGFDVATISDAILHVRYTARDGGAVFAGAVKAQTLAAPPAERVRRHLISVRTEFPEAWAQFLGPQQPSTPQSLTMALDTSLFPHVFGHSPIGVSNIKAYAYWQGRAASTNGGMPYWYSESAAALDVTFVFPPPNGQVPTTVNGALNRGIVSLPSGAASNFGYLDINGSSTVHADGSDTWALRVASSAVASLKEGLYTVDTNNEARLDDSLQDIWLAVEYTQPLPSWA